MTIAQQLIGQEKDIGGGFRVRRVLPAARQRSVGPFIFFDHFGPAEQRPGDNHDVRPHPHIGLATVTYLFEGAMMHRDSLGTEQLIEPGAINWMTAGRGIVHSERKPEAWRDRVHVNHGLQLWVALPQAHEEDEPSFSHTGAADIPETAQGDAHVRVLVGDAFGLRSPVPALSPTTYLDVALRAGGRFELPPLAEELAVYALEQPLVIDGERVEPHTMAVLAPGVAARVEAPQGARFAVIGGAALDAPRHMWWNFVSSRRERIVQASADWEAQRMGQVPGEHEFIPLPAARFVA